MRVFLSKFGWILSIVYSLLFVTLFIWLTIGYKNISCDPNPYAGICVQSPTENDIKIMRLVIFPWGLGMENWSQMSEQAVYRQAGLGPFTSALIPSPVLGSYLNFLVINIVILYVVGYGLERWFKEKHTNRT